MRQMSGVESAVSDSIAEEKAAGFVCDGISVAVPLLGVPGGSKRGTLDTLISSTYMAVHV
jgi:hypothetical protein